MKKTRDIFCLFLAICLTTAITGCGKEESPPAKPSAVPAETPIPPPQKAAESSSPVKEAAVEKEAEPLPTRRPGAPETPASRDAARRAALERMQLDRAKASKAPAR